MPTAELPVRISAIRPSGVSALIVAIETVGPGSRRASRFLVEKAGDRRSPRCELVARRSLMAVDADRQPTSVALGRC